MSPPSQGGTPLEDNSHSMILGEMRGLDVGPALALAYLNNMARRDAELLAGSHASELRTANGQDHIGSKSSARMGLASGGSTSTLAYSVGDVLQMLAPKQVRRIAARWVVAMVAGAMPFRRARVARQDQRQVGRALNAAAQLEIPIAVLRSVRRPRPASRRRADIHLASKAGFRLGVNVLYRENSHSAVPSRGGQGRTLFPQRFRPVFFRRNAGKMQPRAAA